ncbi:hypothetical protein [Amycolatopsis sp. cmx-4-61]|uniref:hypothetical protein n=1 Tax=Amycolatopsis sp. cmx-4-61 TaxID=2790937 RepID=UPI003978C47D
MSAAARQLRDIADRLWLHSLGWRLPAEEDGNRLFAQLTADVVRLARQIAEFPDAHAAGPGRCHGRRNETAEGN